MANIITDPIESTKPYKKVKNKVDREVKRIMRNDPTQRGRQYTMWYHKKRILKEKYGISWRSPAEMNPHIDFS